MSYNSKDGLLAVCSTLTGLSVIAVGLRFYARKQQKLPLKADDWAVVPSLVSFSGAAICVFIAVSNKALGYSIPDFTPEQLMAMNQVEQQLDFAFIVFIIATWAFTKLSALFFYRRIFCVGQYMQIFSIVTIVSIVIVCLWLVTFELLAGLQCGTHFTALWDGTYDEYCTISFAFLYGLAISDFLLDVWILALPIPVIMRLHTDRRKKLSITGLFLLAFIGLGASTARMVIMIQVETGGAIGLFSDPESTFSVAALLLSETHLSTYNTKITSDVVADTETSYLCMLEAGMSLVAVNLPSLWLLLTTVVPDKLKHTMFSVLSLRSSGHSDKEAVDKGAGSSSTNLKRHGPSSTDSQRPVLYSGDDLSYPRFPPHNLRGDLEDQKYETYAMHKMDGNGPVRDSLGRIHMENTVELHLENIPERPRRTAHGTGRVS